MMPIVVVKCPHDGAMCHHICPVTMGLNDDGSVICYRQKEGMSLTQGIDDTKIAPRIRSLCPIDNGPCPYHCTDNVPLGPMEKICRLAIEALAPRKASSDLSPDAPTVENERGGRQSHVAARLDLLDGPTILRLGVILGQGAKKYGDNNWRNIDCEDHVNHALIHLMGYLTGDRQDDHLGHALCRLMFACATEDQK